MSLLSINKIYKVIETAELVYGSMISRMRNQPETFLDKLSNYLEDFNITGKCSVNVLQKYIQELSEEEKAEVNKKRYISHTIDCKANIEEVLVIWLFQNYMERI